MTDILGRLPDRDVNEQERQDRLAWGWYALGAAASTALIIGIPSGGLTAAVDALKANEAHSVQSNPDNPGSTTGQNCLSDTPTSGKLIISERAAVLTAEHLAATSLSKQLGTTALQTTYNGDFCYITNAEGGWYGLPADEIGTSTAVDTSSDRDDVAWVNFSYTRLIRLKNKSVQP